MKVHLYIKDKRAEAQEVCDWIGVKLSKMQGKPIIWTYPAQIPNAAVVPVAYRSKWFVKLPYPTRERHKQRWNYLKNRILSMDQYDANRKVSIDIADFRRYMGYDKEKEL